MPLLQAASHHVLRDRQVLRLPAALPQLRIGLRLTGGGKSYNPPFNYSQMYHKYGVYIQYECMYVCMDGWMDGWMHACMHVCMHVCMYNIWFYVYYKHHREKSLILGNSG